ncbi:hypothetical protein HWV62_34217 [Athelia sp. TMB]|nr:hypothetical protein HWV62_34217 [Athelia sp. TMB]
MRARAVYHDSKFAQIFFGTFWVAVLSTSILLLASIENTTPLPSGICTFTARSYGNISSIVSAVFDTSVFFAISWRLASRTAFVGNTLRARLRCFFSGKGLSVLPKALLHGGQAYYCATLGFAIMSSIMYVKGPPSFHTLLGPPYLAVSNVMACQVFRDVMLYDRHDTDVYNVEMTSLHLSAGESQVITLTYNDIAPLRPPCARLADMKLKNHDYDIV